MSISNSKHDSMYEQIAAKVAEGAYMIGTNQNCWRGKKPLIQIHHDESTYTNADQSHYWADDHVIFEEKFPHAQALFLFDNVPIHCKSSDDAIS